MKINKKEVQKKAKKFWAIAWPFICRTWVNIIWPFVIQWGIKRWILPACLVLAFGGNLLKEFKFTNSASAPAGGTAVANGAVANLYDATGKKTGSVHIPLGAKPKYTGLPAAAGNTGTASAGVSVHVNRIGFCFVVKGGVDYVMAKGLTPGISSRLLYFGKRTGIEAWGNLYGPKAGLDWQSPLFRQNMTVAFGICPKLADSIEWWRLYGGVAVAF